ncbi:MAG: hypothetical protein ACR2KC_03530 [Acidimicrobiales bacterium]
MLTKGDEYPLHQTAEPIAYAGTDRNFYDRYFFNGYTRGGEVFFAAALGVYPHLGIMDAAFSVLAEGRQYNLHASRVTGGERLDTSVGPIRLEIIEPLRRLRLVVGANEYGIGCDLEVCARSAPVEEPRFTWRNGTRVLMDVTRMTQAVRWSGQVSVGGSPIDLAGQAVWGTRDRSWGVRPVGAPDPQAAVPAMVPQFYWLWAPLSFEDHATLYHVNEDASGGAWNTHARICPDGDAPSLPMSGCSSTLRFAPGSRHATSAVLRFDHDGGAHSTIDLEVQRQFYMQGIGYGHPEWGHGAYKGGMAVGYDELVTDAAGGGSLGYLPPNLHIQAIVSATEHRPDGSVAVGTGVLEQLIVGPHAPSRFVDLLDPAPAEATQASSP